MFMDRIASQPGRNGLIAVRLLRRWVAFVRTAHFCE